MDKKIGAILIAVIFVVAIVGGYYGYQEYLSYTYNENLKVSSDMMNKTHETLKTVSIQNKSYDTNIQIIKDSMNYTDVAINSTQKMIGNAPDAQAKEFAELRMSNLKEMKNYEELILKVCEDMKSSGIWAVVGEMDTMTQTMDGINQRVDSNNEKISQLITATPQLKSRLMDVLGENKTKLFIDPKKSIMNSTV